MSKRFGRNQRRRAREQIAALELESSNAKWAHRMCMEHREAELQMLREARQVIADATAIAGEFSVLFPAKEYRTELSVKEVAGGSRVRVPVGPQDGFMYPSESVDKMQIAAVDLPMMLARIDRSELNARVHVLVRFNDGSGNTGYAINPKELYLYPERVMRDRIAKAIAPDIARHLLSQYRKG